MFQVSIFRKLAKPTGKYLKTEHREILAAVYEQYREVFPKVPLMTTAEVQAVLDVAKSPRAKQSTPEDFFDNSLVQKIQSPVFIDSPYPRP